MKQGMNQYEEMVSRFSRVKICIIGDIMLDRYIVGKVKRISPEAPVPIVEVFNEFETLGGAANVGNNICSLNNQPYIISVIGKDNHGKLFKTLLKEKKISTKYLVEDPDRPTTVKTRIIGHNQQLVRIDHETKHHVSDMIHEQIIQNFKKVLPEVNAVIISDYAKGLITKKLMREIIGLCNENQIFIAVDPKQNDFYYYQGADILTPNDREAGLPYNTTINSHLELIETGKRVMKDFDFSSLLVTRGEHGMTLFRDQDTTIEIPAVAREVFDVSGAGDTVISVFTLCKCVGCSLKTSAMIANFAAGIVVGKLGTAVITPTELIQDLENRFNINEFELEKN